MDKNLFLALERVYGEMPQEITVPEDDDEDMDELIDDYDTAVEMVRELYLYLAEKYGYKAKYQ